MDVLDISQPDEVMVTNEIYLVMAVSVILITFKFVYYFRLKIETTKKCKFLSFARFSPSSAAAAFLFAASRFH